MTTGIFKEPVSGPVRIRTLNLHGDRQADLRVHGGHDKAVYAYPSEFYELWRNERPELPFPWGQFGENLTTQGLRDEDVSVGDRFRVGTAELIVTQPRLPCFKLGIRMGRDDFVTEFLQRGLYGFYMAVAREGAVEAGDPIVPLSRDPRGFEVTELEVCNQFTLQAEAFAAAILDERPQPVPLEDAVANMACIDAVSRSAASGRWEVPSTAA